jgi:hypothetical protein
VRTQTLFQRRFPVCEPLQKLRMLQPGAVLDFIQQGKAAQFAAWQTRQEKEPRQNEYALRAQWQEKAKGLGIDTERLAKEAKAHSQERTQKPEQRRSQGHDRHTPDRGSQRDRGQRQEHDYRLRQTIALARALVQERSGSGKQEDTAQERAVQEREQDRGYGWER